MNPEKIIEKQRNNKRLARIGAGALLITSLVTGAGCSAEQPAFSDSTHEYVVPNNGTLWGAAGTIEGVGAIDKHDAIDYIRAMPENNVEYGALKDGRLDPNEHLVVPDSVEL